MRTYGRSYREDGTYVWVTVTTDANGYNDDVYLTTLAQVLQLSPGESPFFSNYGVPSKQAVQQQVPPDYYMALTQAQFAAFFANLQIQRVPSAASEVAYSVRAVTNQGAIIQDVIYT